MAGANLIDADAFMMAGELGFRKRGQGYHLVPARVRVPSPANC
jgi:hypothetical protein